MAKGFAILVSILSNRGGISDLSVKEVEELNSKSQSSLIEAVFLTKQGKIKTLMERGLNPL